MGVDKLNPKVQKAIEAKAEKYGGADVGSYLRYQDDQARKEEEGKKRKLAQKATGREDPTPLRKMLLGE